MKYFNWFRKNSLRGNKSNFKYKKLKVVSSFSDVPEKIGEDIYVIKSGEFYKWVMFMCPNHCGERIDVNLMKARDPRWELKIKKDKVTLYPSVVVETCGAHFWLYKSEVEWAYFTYEKK